MGLPKTYEEFKGFLAKEGVELRFYGKDESTDVLNLAYVPEDSRCHPLVQREWDEKCMAEFLRAVNASRQNEKNPRSLEILSQIERICLGSK